MKNVNRNRQYACIRKYYNDSEQMECVFNFATLLFYFTLFIFC